MSGPDQVLLLRLDMAEAQNAALAEEVRALCAVVKANNDRLCEAFKLISELARVYREYLSRSTK